MGAQFRLCDRAGKVGGKTMRLLVGSVALAAMVCAATAVSAQSPQQSQINSAANVGRHASDASSKGSSDEPKVKANDKAYNAALRNLPDKQFDPWRGVR
jgi:hypothetical protein